MEASVNEALKLIASALKILECLHDEDQIKEMMKLLQEAVDKLSTCSM